jgi:Family of unknown function (DUF6328)
MSTTQEKSHEERVDQELIELLNELRVALPGIQVLFAFLLTVPFTRGWPLLDHSQRIMYFLALILAAVASGFLIAPSAQHQLHFRHEDKEKLIIWGNRMALLGLLALALAITSSIALVADYIYGDWISILVTVGMLIFLGVLWFGLPQLYGSDRGADD